MKQLFGYILFALIVVSCSSPDGSYRLEGRFRNFNQGELYLYNAEKGTKDTIQLFDGRFAIERSIEDTAVFVMVFPNFSELPIVAYPGAKIKMEGNASHLKETIIEGTKENEMLTNLRQNANAQTPPETQQQAMEIIKDDPLSPVSRYLLRKYFIQTALPDYDQAHQVLQLMLKEQPNSAELKREERLLKGLKQTARNKKLPAFKAKTIDNTAVSNSTLKGQANVVYIWANWHYESTNMQRELQRLRKQYGERLGLLGICLEPLQKDCRNTIGRDSIGWPTVCDGEMWQTALAEQLGLQTLPGNIVCDASGRIVAKNLSTQELKDQLSKMLK